MITLTPGLIMSWKPCSGYPRRRVEELFGGKSEVTMLELFERTDLAGDEIPWISKKLLKYISKEEDYINMWMTTMVALKFFGMLDGDVDRYVFYRRGTYGERLRTYQAEKFGENCYRMLNVCMIYANTGHMGPTIHTICGAANREDVETLARVVGKHGISLLVELVQSIDNRILENYMMKFFSSSFGSHMFGDIPFEFHKHGKAINREILEIATANYDKRYTHNICEEKEEHNAH